MSKFVAWQVVSLLKNEQQAKICCSKYTRAQPFATTFFNPKQLCLLRDKLITLGEKRETPTQKLVTKQCCATSWGFLYLVLYRLQSVSGGRKKLKICFLIQTPFLDSTIDCCDSNDEGMMCIFYYFPSIIVEYVAGFSALTVPITGFKLLTAGIYRVIWF